VWLLSLDLPIFRNHNEGSGGSGGSVGAVPSVRYLTLPSQWPVLASRVSSASTILQTNTNCTPGRIESMQAVTQTPCCTTCDS
jgi:hypothetical protein